MTEPAKAQSFAEDLHNAGALVFNPWWMGVNSGTPQPATDFTAPDIKPVVVGEGRNNWRAALKSAVSMIPMPGTPSAPMQAAVARSTREIARGSSEFMRASAAAVQAAGKGITSGFRWVVMLVFLGLILYVLAVLGPFIPKPQAGGV